MYLLVFLCPLLLLCLCLFLCRCSSVSDWFVLRLTRDVNVPPMSSPFSALWHLVRPDLITTPWHGPGTVTNGIQLASLPMDVTQNKNSFGESNSFPSALWHYCFMGSANLAHLEMSNYPMLSLCLTWRRERIKRGSQKAKLFLMRSQGHLLTLNVDQRISDVWGAFKLQLKPQATCENFNMAQFTFLHVILWLSDFFVVSIFSTSITVCICNLQDSSLIKHIQYSKCLLPQTLSWPSEGENCRCCVRLYVCGDQETDRPITLQWHFKPDPPADGSQGGGLTQAWRTPRGT